VAAVPALAEEFAMRGVVMQQLRRHGDRFAIITSAALFAVMHGNLIQAPFAFFLGLALGYFTVITGSIWTAISIHFLNNFFSVLVSAATDLYGEERVSIPAGIIMLFLILFGVCCLMQFIRVAKGRRLCPPAPHAIKAKSKAACFFCAPLMLIALAFLFYSTWMSIEFPP
jgi:membrane protease YdiL (CAAX protease family)